MNKNINLTSLMNQKPDAYAIVRGSKIFPGIIGRVNFYKADMGVMVAASIKGLPTNSSPCAKPIFAMHIHGGASCSGNDKDYFADAGTHFNPDNCPHPYHAGDMPPLFGCGGATFSAFLTDRFLLEEVIGKTINEVMMKGKKPAENPIAIFNLALPGSGKTGLNGMCLKQFKNSNVVIINSDKLKPFHPKAEEIAKLYPQYYT